MKKQIKKQKSKFLAVKLARAAVGALSVVLLNPVASAQTESIFANTYVLGAAGSEINGDVLAGTYLTTGASAVINGNTASATITTLGASASVTGSLQSGTSIVYGAGATAGSDSVSPVTTITAVQAAALAGQSALNAMPTTTVLAPGNIATDVTFTAGVYKVTGLKSVTAGKTITLQGDGSPGAEFIFNIGSYLSFGADVKVVVVNSPNAIVYWNAGGYVSIGAGADIVGTVMAHTYVSTGAYSVVRGPNNTCGGAIYSATSYVTVGAYATVGAGEGCEPVEQDEQVHCNCEVWLWESGVSISWENCCRAELALGDYFVVISPDGTGGRKRTKVVEGCSLNGLIYDRCDDYYEVWLYTADGCGADRVCAGSVGSQTVYDAGLEPSPVD